MGDTEMTPVPMRIPDADWQQFRAAHGRDAAALVRAFIAWQLYRPGSAEPSRPPAGSVPPVPPDVLGQLIAWYLRQPGAVLPRRPAGETAPKMIRVPAADWREFVGLHGGKATEAVKMYIAWSLHRPGALLPMRPPGPSVP